ncbi:helix-turn-helix transcriptional regulator [Streptomyces sp. NPDC060053]|uniref:helix-turn-helix transcriptional regulator n=1 Tax=Streptomyces sp. NPDC060053 TaxID=3347047 RepID=UPI0036798411
MTNDDDQRSLSAIVGERLKQFRYEKDLRQADIAAAASTVGLQWVRSSVAAIEAGSRNISLEEFFQLPWVIVAAGGWDKPFLPADTSVKLGTFLTTVNGMAMGMVMLQEPMGGFGDAAPERVQRMLNQEQGLPVETPENEVDFRDPVDLIWRTVCHLVYPRLDYNRISRQSVAEMELISKVSGRLKMPDNLEHDWQPIAVFSWGLWGHSLQTERDRRASGKEYATPRSLQSARGHVTRELISEIAAEANRQWPVVEGVIREVWPARDDPKKLARWYRKTLRDVGISS